MTNTIKDTLQQLSQDPKNRSDTARLRDIVDDVEKALKAGVKRETVFKALQDNGFEKMSFKSFESALYRIRKERRRVGVIANSVQKCTREK